MRTARGLTESRRLVAALKEAESALFERAQRRMEDTAAFSETMWHRNRVVTLRRNLEEELREAEGVSETEGI